MANFLFLSDQTSDIRINIRLNANFCKVCGGIFSCLARRGLWLTWCSPGIPPEIRWSRSLHSPPCTNEHLTDSLAAVSMSWQPVNSFDQCFGSVFIRHGSWSSSSGWIPIRIQPGSRVLTKNWRNLQVKKIKKFYQKLQKKLWNVLKCCMFSFESWRLLL